jgi:hypothetical protein
LRQVALGGAVSQLEIRGIADTRRPGMAEHDDVVGLSDQITKISRRRPGSHGQAVEQKNQDHGRTRNGQVNDLLAGRGLSL